MKTNQTTTRLRRYLKWMYEASLEVETTRYFNMKWLELKFDSSE